eukprot:TRINITY_DN4493_c0_g1_i1.p1 TRINITY_DN4493_c0_g1~~TRINITY_DN4493_c0_g1_i1.p1  ORF type:complete len:149 (+),score=69.91 TRINITY_DN4493_c0_g1_i1:524-970(+)
MGGYKEYEALSFPHKGQKLSIQNQERRSKKAEGKSAASSSTSTSTSTSTPKPLNIEDIEKTKEQLASKKKDLDEQKKRLLEQQEKLQEQKKIQVEIRKKQVDAKIEIQGKFQGKKAEEVVDEQMNNPWVGWALGLAQQLQKMKKNVEL